VDESAANRMQGGQARFDAAQTRAIVRKLSGFPQGNESFIR
jgi:hypothetical protein